MCKRQGRTVLSPVMEEKWRTGIVVEVCQAARAESHHLHRNSMIFSSFKEVFIFLQAGFLGTTILTSHIPIPLPPARPPCWNSDWLDLQVVSCIKLLSTITMPYTEGSSLQLSSPIHLILYSFHPLFVDIPWALDDKKLVYNGAHNVIYIHCISKTRNLLLFYLSFLKIECHWTKC